MARRAGRCEANEVPLDELASDGQDQFRPFPGVSEFAPGGAAGAKLLYRLVMIGLRLPYTSLRCYTFCRHPEEPRQPATRRLKKR